MERSSHAQASGSPLVLPPHRAVSRLGGRWRSARPADPGARGSHSRGFLFFPFPTTLSSSRLRPQSSLPRGSGDLGDAGSQGGEEAPCSPWALSHLGMWVEVPHSDAPGIGSWAGARGGRQVSAPEAPPNPPTFHHSLTPPPFMERGRQGPWIPTVERGRAPGRGAGAGLLLPFLASQLWRCPLLPLGPDRRVGFCGGLLPSPTGAAGLQLAGTGGWASSREGRAEPGRLCSEPGARLGWISLPA